MTLLDASVKKTTQTNETVILNVFALSGIAALIYQVCWQRLLFTAFGVDVESITIIVSAFMLGLGFGSLVGGVIADQFPDRILFFFIGFEFAIGVFGFLSPILIGLVADRFATTSVAAISISNFCLLLFPTILMGSTLPMLVVYLHKTTKNVGISIGKLYFVNTLGASLGSIFVGFIFFNFLTIIQTIYLAATLNVIVATIAVFKIRFRNPS